MDSTLIEIYIELGRQFATYITDVSMEINEALDEGKHVMAEAAQGTHLDIIHGTQKFVTSSSTIAGSACTNLGVGPTRVENVIAIVKAYITRVGGRPTTYRAYRGTRRKDTANWVRIRNNYR